MTASGAAYVDLDDSRVIQITREPGRIIIEQEQLRGNATRRITVTVSGVTREEAAHYIGHNVTAAHPNPDSPLDFVEYAEKGPEHLELAGYLDNEPWFVWRLDATRIDITER